MGKCKAEAIIHNISLGKQKPKGKYVSKNKVPYRKRVWDRINYLKRRGYVIFTKEQYDHFIETHRTDR